ncbi:PREDICTED: methyltransferase-like protein 13 [Camelina sativa]|uniref:Methyltransferase-like protein 13 n=1 Tax=Camelina sativa TaxID=90675 RepID=A0ABM0XTW4_CAMSA|nr:PREDICTED: methyltransferase-like protein 13 [Camelina sativa]
MALDVRIFENISPSRFVSFTIPNPNSPPFHLLRIAVLDSPVHSTDSSSSPRAVAAILVPKHRESDWIFSTESGHLQLLLNLPDISRLFLIGNDPGDGYRFPAVYHRPTGENDDESERLEMRMKPFVVALSPKTLTRDEIDDVPFLIYDDNVVSSVELERSVGPFVGEMLIEDVEIEIDDGVREFRRRLRFKRMPNLVQSDIKIIPTSSSSLTRTEFNLDLTELVHPYLVPMVASLSLIDDSQSDDKFKSRPKALCIGVGGGGLLSFLRIQLGFEVTGVEIDPEVLRIARQYFGLEESFARVHVEDGIEFLKRCSSSCGDDAKFDALMVDLDSTDPIHGMTAPPVEFVAKDVLLAARTLLVPSGVFVINVIPPNKTFYKELQDKFRDVFTELYEIDVGNGENFVLIATVSPRGLKSGFNRENLTPAVSEKFLDAIRRI